MNVLVVNLIWIIMIVMYLVQDLEKIHNQLIC